MERRPPKPTDQEQIEKGFDLVKNLMSEHQEIEPSLWAGTMWSILVDGYINCGWTYKQFTEECDRVKNHFKDWFLAVNVDQEDENQ